MALCGASAQAEDASISVAKYRIALLITERSWKIVMVPA
jgi:hypothetical protein